MEINTKVMDSFMEQLKQNVRENQFIYLEVINPEYTIWNWIKATELEIKNNNTLLITDTYDNGYKIVITELLKYHEQGDDSYWKLSDHVKMMFLE